MKRARPYDRDVALDAAMTLFWSKGYHATSLKDLEAALAMKPGSIYAAFSSKENLYLLSMERYFKRGVENVQMLLDETGSPLDALASHLRQFGRSEGTRACMLVRTVLEATEHEEALSARARVYLEAMRDAFTDGFRRAQAAGELSRELVPEQLARRFQANVAALRLEVHRGSPRADVEALAEEMAREVEALRL